MIKTVNQLLRVLKQKEKFDRYTRATIKIRIRNKNSCSSKKNQQPLIIKKAGMQTVKENAGLYYPPIILLNAS